MIRLRMPLASAKRSSVFAGCTFTSNASGARLSHSAATGWRPAGITSR